MGRRRCAAGVQQLTAAKVPGERDHDNQVQCKLIIATFDDVGSDLAASRSTDCFYCSTDCLSTGHSAFTFSPAQRNVQGASQHTADT